MKSYDETINTVISKMDAYETEKKRRKKIILSATATICIVAVLTAGVGVFMKNSPSLGNFKNGGIPWNPDAAKNGQSAEDAIYPGIKDTFDDKNGEDADDPSKNNRINIVETEKLPENNYGLFYLHTEDFISFTPEEMTSYYSVNVFPVVPSDMQLKDGVYGIFARNKDMNEIYWDQSHIEYRNEDKGRYLTVSVDKNTLPYSFLDIFSGEEAISVINNIEVGIARTPYGDMYAEFFYKGNGFRIVSTGLSEEELINSVTSLLT